MEWDSNTAWRKQVERRLYELGAMAKGQIPIQADRISDLLAFAVSRHTDYNTGVTVVYSETTPCQSRVLLILQRDCDNVTVGGFIGEPQWEDLLT